MNFPLVFFDCDGVLIFNLLWSDLNQAFGISAKQDRKWYEDYYQGRLSFKEWNERIEKYYRKNKLKKRQFERCLSNFSLNPEAKELVDFLHQKGVKMAIISSGIDFYIKKVAQKLEISLWRANYSFIFDKKGNFVKMKYLTDDPQAKVLHIKEICQELSIKPTETAYIGDSMNDCQAFKLTQHGVLYRGNDKRLTKLCWLKVDNLLELKRYLNRD